LRGAKTTALADSSIDDCLSCGVEGDSVRGTHSNTSATAGAYCAVDVSNWPTGHEISIRDWPSRRRLRYGKC